MDFQNIELLRFTTAGSVDDGKSTLIGRLLYDSKSIFQDQLDAVETTSKNKGFDYVDLSLLTDGLKSEREQGITKMWPIAILQPQKESLLWRTLQDISNILAIW